MINRSHKLSKMSPDVLHCELSNSDGYARDWHAHDCHMLLLPRHGSLLLSTEDHGRSAPLSSLSFSVIAPDFGHATCAAHGRESHLTLYVDPDYLRRHGARHAGIDFDAMIAGHGQWQRSDILDSMLALHDKLWLATSSPHEPPHLHHLHHLLFEECMRIVAGSKRIGGGKNHNQALLIRQVQSF